MSPLVTLGASQVKLREGGSAGSLLATPSNIVGGSGTGEGGNITQVEAHNYIKVYLPQPSQSLGEPHPVSAQALPTYKNCKRQSQ